MKAHSNKANSEQNHPDTLANVNKDIDK